MREHTEQEMIQIPPALPYRLLAWYDQGHRKLRWREHPTPYYVWVSEIMLQQTRVEAVKAYFDRFVETLPDIPSLAAAEEELLMKLWEGLGYYRRVRNMQAAAKLMMQEYGGEMPNSYPLIRELPGIGDYTAGAIASIAFGLPKAAVDGNVLRVLSRVCEDYRDILKQPIKRDMTRALEKIYPKDRCGDFTQSLMELGATVCIPNGAPKCEICPLQDLCLAHLSRTTDELPVKSQKKPRKMQEKTVFLLEKDGKFAVKRREDTGLLAGMWELPNTDGFLDEAAAQAYVNALGIHAETPVCIKKANHVFTHIEWKMQLFQVACREVKGTPFCWVSPEEIALPTAFKKLLQ